MLNKLPKIVNHEGKRHGRGIGSGKGGHTTGRGMKGQKARSGDHSPRPGFEGGQMPLSRRIPKLKGFSRKFYAIRANEKIIDISKLSIFKDGDIVNKSMLVDKDLISASTKAIKIVGNGELKTILHFEGIKFTASARFTVEKAGGSIK